MFRGQQLSKEQALQKLRHYCSYQDRSHQEVKEKLYSFNLRKQEVEESISQLIEENYLNEERFAIQFAGGKFRIKHWGRIKIAQALKQRRVSDYCIRRALEEIEEEPYLQLLRKLAEKKWNTLKKEGNRFIRLQKTRSYLVQKGFEPRLIDVVLKPLGNGEDNQG
ncbi:MAG TPA: regulatory protein RecX [Chitinophagaceae bacterium]